MINGRESLVFGVVAGLVGVTLFFVMSLRKNKKRKCPREGTEWKEIGTLKEMFLFPLKSGRYVELENAELTSYGLKETNDGTANFRRRDRCFIVMRSDTKEMITARTYPTLLKVQTESLKSSVVFKYPGKEDLVVNLSSLESQPPDSVKMWHQERVQKVDCGDDAAKWISEVIDPETSQQKYRIGFWPEAWSERRDIVGASSVRAKAFPNMTVLDSGTYSDLASYNLITTSSMDDLNKKIHPLEVSVKQFRPNFYVKTNSLEPFQEDDWKWVKIGDSIFENIKPCTRCTLTTIDPETCKRHPKLEPLKTLKTYRQLTDPKMRASEGDSPVMGINLGLVQGSKVSVGDVVYAAAK